MAVACRSIGGSIHVFVPPVDVGVFYVMDFVLNFNVTYLVAHQYQKYEITDPRMIANYYIRYGTFYADVWSVAAVVGQVVSMAVGGDGAGKNVVLILRMLRMVRVIKLLKVNDWYYIIMGFYG